MDDLVVTAPEAGSRRAIEAVWRIESARLIGRIARLVGDLAVAEDLAQDALVTALEKWPETGVPDNPGAWLMAVAKRRAIDHLRRGRRVEEKHEEIAGRDPGSPDVEAELAQAIDDPVRDDLLRLVFICCHPVLPREARVALTLRILGGLSTDEIARGFLVPKATLAQRIVRAKRTLSEAGVPMELPPREELAERLPSVLEVVYLIFNEGYSATAGDDWVRPALCQDALRLGRILAGLVPDDAEVLGLLALMEIQASRLAARVGPRGEPVLLLDQDRSRWDRLLIRRGLAALARAESVPGGPGPYGLQAAIAACHACAPTAEDTDWDRIVALYAVMAAVAPSPIVEVNRAVAVGMASGPAAGLEIVDRLAEEEKLRGYPYLPAVRGDLLEKLGRHEEARTAFERAADLTRNARDRQILLDRAARL